MDWWPISSAFSLEKLSYATIYDAFKRYIHTINYQRFERGGKIRKDYHSSGFVTFPLGLICLPIIKEALRCYNKRTTRNMGDMFLFLSK